MSEKKTFMCEKMLALSCNTESKACINFVEFHQSGDFIFSVMIVEEAPLFA